MLFFAKKSSGKLVSHGSLTGRISCGILEGKRPVTVGCVNFQANDAVQENLPLLMGCLCNG